MIPQACDRCAGIPELKKQWNCDGPPQSAAVERIPDDQGETIEYFNCPIQFVPAGLWAFMRKYSALKGGMAAPRCFDEESAWFHSAVSYFDRWVNFFMIRKNGNG